MGFRATLCVHCTACGGVTFFGWIRNRLDQKQTRSETNGSSQQPTKKIPQSFGIFQKTTKPKFLTLNPPVVRNPKKTIGLFFFTQKTAYEMLRSLVGSEMCIRDRFKLV